MIQEGALLSVDRNADQGSILAAKDSSVVRFRLSTFEGDAASLVPGTAVAFRTHPDNPRRAVSVQVIVRAPSSATVIHASETAILARLATQQQVYLSPRIWPPELFPIGTRVRCIVTEGRDGRLFALTTTLDPNTSRSPPRTANRPAPPEPRPELAAVSRRGTRSNKSHNDDAFLVCQLGSDAWLLALADGVSGSKEGWWAADRCLSLLWRTRGKYQPRFASSESGEKLVLAWLEDVRRGFLQERRLAPTEYQGATSTFTIAVVRGKNAWCAQCGDSRVLYVRDRKLTDVFAGKLRTQIRSDRSRQPLLTSHIGTAPDHWKPLHDTFTLGPTDTLMLCSDGMIAGEREEAKRTLLGDVPGAASLQESVMAAARAVADHGETDDLTLVCLRRKVA